MKLRMRDLNYAQRRILEASSDARKRVQNGWAAVDAVTFERILNVKIEGQTIFTLPFDEAADYLKTGYISND